MIIKAKIRAGPTQLADYLLRNEKNERAELLEMRGFHVPTLKGALRGRRHHEAIRHLSVSCFIGPNKEMSGAVRSISSLAGVSRN